MSAPAPRGHRMQSSGQEEEDARVHTHTQRKSELLMQTTYHFLAFTLSFFFLSHFVRSYNSCLHHTSCPCRLRRRWCASRPEQDLTAPSQQPLFQGTFRSLLNLTFCIPLCHRGILNNRDSFFSSSHHLQVRMKKDCRLR